MTTPLPTGFTSGTWTIDPAHSEAAFTVRHAGIAKVRGTVTIQDGVISAGDNLESSAVKATMDATSIATGDQGRDTHLRSDDFFAVESFPTWTFTSTGVRRDDEDYLLVGDLTIHGVTREVTLEVEFAGTATDPFGNQRAGFSAETEISRKDFGLTWNAVLETGGVLVSDKVKITIEISAIHQD